jgi:hypothetical protein
MKQTQNRKIKISVAPASLQEIYLKELKMQKDLCSFNYNNYNNKNNE